MDEYLAFATKLAHQAGEIMLQHFQIGVSTEIKAHEGNTPVTVADTAINQLVVDTVYGVYPSHAVYGEEQSLKNDDAPYTWVCDPIDGTIPYSAGVPTNVFSLALVDNSDGQPVVAVVYDPYMKRLYRAVKGQGAFVNEVEMHVNHVANFADTMIGTSSQRSKLVDATALKQRIIGSCFRQFSFNSTIYEAMLVASGQFAGQIFVGAGAYDVAAAALIVREAGGKATDIFGGDQWYNDQVRGSLMSNGLIHDELVRLARESRLEVGNEQDR